MKKINFIISYYCIPFPIIQISYRINTKMIRRDEMIITGLYHNQSDHTDQLIDFLLFNYYAMHLLIEINAEKAEYYFMLILFHVNIISRIEIFHR